MTCTSLILGLPCYGNSTRRVRSGRRDQAHTALDQAFVKVMAARHRAARRPAATETRDGNVPEIRQLAEQLLAEQRAAIRKLQRWTCARSKAYASRPPVTASRHPPGHRLWAMARPASPWGDYSNAWATQRERLRCR
jgi:hypothetical protein